MLISCAVTAQLICVFVFAYAKSRVSRDAAQIMLRNFWRANQSENYSYIKYTVCTRYRGKTHLTNFLIILSKTDIKAKDRIAQKLLCFTHDLDTKHQRLF